MTTAKLREARSGAFLYENDNYDNGRSRIEETLASGVYTIEATTNTAGATGSFRLTVVDEDTLSAGVSRAAGSENAVVRPDIPISLTVAFNGPVSGFTAADITVGSGTVSNFTGSDGDVLYTFEVPPNAIAEVTVDIAAGAAEYVDGSGTAALQYSLSIPYDDNSDGTINRSEVITAIRDYFDGGIITRAQVITLIRLYFG